MLVAIAGFAAACSDSGRLVWEPGTEIPDDRLPLAAPVPAVQRIGQTSCEVVWGEVEHACSYDLELFRDGIAAVEQSHRGVSSPVALGGLSPRTAYTVQVRAQAASDGPYGVSPYGRAGFTTESSAERSAVEIEISGITAASVRIRCVPGQGVSTYCCEVVVSADIASKGDAAIVGWLQESYGDRSLGPIRHEGSYGSEVAGLRAATGYTVVAFGFDPNSGKATTRVCMRTFRTLSE